MSRKAEVESRKAEVVSQKAMSFLEARTEEKCRAVLDQEANGDMSM